MAERPAFPLELTFGDRAAAIQAQAHHVSRYARRPVHQLHAGNAVAQIRRFFRHCVTQADNELWPSAAHR